MDAPSALADEPAAGRWGNPAVVAGLWVLVTLLFVFDQVRFPGSDSSELVSSILYLSAAQVLAALVAAAIAGIGHRALTLAALLLFVECVAETVWLTAQWALEGSAYSVDSIGTVIGVAVVIASALLVYLAARREAGSRTRAVLASFAAALVLVTTPFASRFDWQLMALSAQVAPQTESQDPRPSIDQERLWTAQPSLVAYALSRLAAQRTGAGTTYVVSVAASGSQHLFGREARVAGSVLGRAFGAGQRSVLLSNDEGSLYRVPLASTTNLDALLSGLGGKIDPARDLVVLYLTSHGSRDAELTTDLPNYDDLRQISATGLAEGLERAGIRRRVIIISACYSGSWIKPLASDDTIVITAARADRTSFGCSDDRELTYFGEALLKGPLASGASLSESFEAARRRVAGWENAEHGKHSEPQAFVGRNMSAIWRARQPVAAVSAPLSRNHNGQSPER
jgi:hypothetical protein